MKHLLNVLIVFSAIFCTAVVLTQCVDSNLIIRPVEFTNGQEFFGVDIRRISKPRISIATWPSGSVGERVKVIDEGYQNATVIIQHLQPSDAGLYVIDVVLKSSKMLTQQFTVGINEGCITVSDHGVIAVPTNRTTTKLTTTVLPTNRTTTYPTTTVLPTNRTTTYPTTTALPTTRTTTNPTTTALPLGKTTTIPKRSRTGRNISSSSTSREIGNVKRILNTTESIANLDQKSKIIAISIAVAIPVIAITLYIILTCIIRVKTKLQPNTDAEMLKHEVRLLNQMGHTSA